MSGANISNVSRLISKTLIHNNIEHRIKTLVFGGKTMRKNNSNNNNSNKNKMQELYDAEIKLYVKFSDKQK